MMLQQGSRLQAPAGRAYAVPRPRAARCLARRTPGPPRSVPESAKDAPVAAPAPAEGTNGAAKDELAPYIANPYTSGRVSPSMDDGALPAKAALRCHTPLRARCQGRRRQTRQLHSGVRTRDRAHRAPRPCRATACSSRTARCQTQRSHPQPHCLGEPSHVGHTPLVRAEYIDILEVKTLRDKLMPRCVSRGGVRLLPCAAAGQQASTPVAP